MKSPLLKTWQGFGDLSMNTPPNKEAQGRFYLDEFSGKGWRVCDRRHSSDWSFLVDLFMQKHDAEKLKERLNSHPAESAERDRLITEVSEFLESHPTGPTDNEKRRWSQLAEGYLHDFLDHLRGNENDL